MKRYRSILCVAAVILAIAGSTTWANLTNGSFELGTDPGSYQTLDPDSTNIDDWTIVNQIDYIGTYWQASDGSRSIDLSGSSAGAIQQDISTVSGYTYIVSFDMAANPDGEPDIKELSVEAVGVDSQTFSFDKNAWTKTDMGWQTKQWSFVAAAETTTLKFTSLVDTGWGPALDNVVVDVIPAPGAVVLAGIGTVIISYLRRRRAL